MLREAPHGCLAARAVIVFGVNDSELEGYVRIAHRIFVRRNV